MSKKSKKRKRKSRLNAMGKRLVTSSNYVIHVKKVGPFVFQELRELYNMDRDPFVREQFVPETGATLRFPYAPPDVPPNKEDDLEEWTLYHKYRNWYEDFDASEAKYTRARNTLFLELAITSIEHKNPNVDVEHEMNLGSWIDILSNSGIEVNDQNRRVLFLKTVVLEDEQDYLSTLNEAAAEEVSLGDVLRAFEYFQTVLARSSFSQDIPELTNWQQWVNTSAVGDKTSDSDGQDS